jgi:hypothetical protein
MRSSRHRHIIQDEGHGKSDVLHKTVVRKTCGLESGFHAPESVVNWRRTMLAIRAHLPFSSEMFRVNVARGPHKFAGLKIQ